MYDEAQIRALLDFDAPAMHLYDTLSSTNTALKELAASAAPEWTLVGASTQTAGRGRRGHSFYSPESGVYFSVLVMPDNAAYLSSMLTVCAAVCCADAIAAVCSVPTEIKWVNDIYIRGRKVCGILTESAFSASDGRLDYVICGIGINLTRPRGGFPDDISERACALSDFAAPPAPETLIAGILNRLHSYSPGFSPARYIDAYRERSCVTGRDVMVLRGEREIPACAVSIGDDASLVVRYRDGTEEALSSGDVSLRL